MKSYSLALAVLLLSMSILDASEGGNGSYIIIADDQDMQYKMLVAGVFNKVEYPAVDGGFEVVRAKDGQQMLDLVSTYGTDNVALITSDGEMSTTDDTGQKVGMDGDQAVELLRSEIGYIGAVFAISGSREKLDAMHNYVTESFEKPVSFEQVKEAVERELAAYAERKALEDAGVLDAQDLEAAADIERNTPTAEELLGDI